MKNIAIFGAGGLGKEVAATINLFNSKKTEWNFIGFFDDGKEIGTSISRYGKVLGGIEELNKWETQLCVVIAIGNPHNLRSVRERITNPMISYPNIIKDSFRCADSLTLKIGEGNIIQGDCFASCDVTIGSFNLLNGSVKIGHDVTIGDFNVIMPNVIISGEVKIGEENLFGVSSIILQQIRIGKNVRIGAGALLMTKPKDGCTYMGNPAKLFRF